MYRTCLGRVRDASRIRTRRSKQAQNLAIKLQQDVCECHAPFCQMGTHLERMRDASEMHSGHVPDACERYLGAELYRSCNEVTFSYPKLN